MVVSSSSPFLVGLAMFTPPSGLLWGLVRGVSPVVLAGGPVEKLWLGCNTGLLLSAPPVKFVLIGGLEPFTESKILGTAGRDDGSRMGYWGPRRTGDDPRL